MENAQFLTLRFKTSVAPPFSLGEFIFPCLMGGSLFFRKPLSFHSVSFGPDSSSSTLRRMAQLALETQNNAPRGRGPATTSISSSFTVALDTVSNSNGLRERKKGAKTVSGTASADVLGNCGVSEEATWFTYPLKLDQFIGIGKERSQS
jgi:hypothetical protein